MLSKVLFSIMGAITLCFVCGIILAIILAAGHWSGHVPPLTLAVFVRLFLIAVALSVVELGLIGGRKWAALAFSIMTVGYALLVVREIVQGIIHPIPGRDDWVGFVFALVLSIPTVVTVKAWRTLVWRRTV